MRSRKFSMAVAAGALALVLPIAAALAAGGGGGSSSSGGGGSNSSADGELKKAQTAISMQDYDTAMDHLNKAIKYSPNSADALNLMGFTERKLGNLDESLEYYDQALAFEPQHLGANEYLGELYLEMKQSRKAKERLAVLKQACGGLQGIRRAQGKDRRLQGQGLNGDRRLLYRGLRCHSAAALSRRRRRRGASGRSEARITRVR